MTVKVQVVDDGMVTLDEVADPEGTFTELVKALQRFDRGEMDESLDEPYSAVVRDIPIEISERRDDEDDHPEFTHMAKLVVTMSDNQVDSLENSICLFRKPEMVVQTLKR